MATVLNDNDIVEARVVCWIPEQISVNRLFYKVSNKQRAGADTLAVADELDQQFEQWYKAIMPTTANYRGVSVQRVFPVPRTVADVAITNAATGSAVGALMPTQVSALCGKKTDFAGPKFRGRTYVPFPSDTFNDAAGNPTNVFVTGQLTNLAIVLRSVQVVGVLPDTIDLLPVLFNTATSVATDVKDFLARTRWATQRRRGAYGAQNVLPF